MLEALIPLVTWQVVAVFFLGYPIWLAFYRLTFHPLARFPGPKLAAISRVYEFYYDIILDGQYTFQLDRLHKKYGPIIRISPYELHINDPSFFNQVYCYNGRWDKSDFTVNGFSEPGATIFTANHHIHRARRAVLNPYFSKARVAAHQDVIRKYVTKLCGRLSDSADSKKITNVGAAITAAARDISNDYILGKHHNALDSEHFETDIALGFAEQSNGVAWRVGKFAPWFIRMFKAIPLEFVAKFTNDIMKRFIEVYLQTMRDTRDIMDTVNSSKRDPGASRTLINNILESELPPSDKTFERVFVDTFTVAAAGFETTGNVLRLILFHTYTKSEILEKLRAELNAAGVDSPTNLDLKALEQLPYLTAVIEEGLRLSPGIATRMGRIAPDRDIFYKEWRIPAGTPFGMTQILMHTDENLYPDPQSFNPERWIDLQLRKKAEKAYAPFSRGTRMCLGAHLAWGNMYMILVALVQNFDFKFHNATAEDFSCTIDSYTIGTKGNGMMEATVTNYSR
uniref:TRI23 n=1 Tax=Trichoderma turrialbense TaxID=490623 RepID=A0A5B8ZS16_9HYPO|nr:TRI23 [Trichoderma turrialbense]